MAVEKIVMSSHCNGTFILFDKENVLSTTLKSKAIMFDNVVFIYWTNYCISYDFVIDYCC